MKKQFLSSTISLLVGLWLVLAGVSSCGSDTAAALLQLALGAPAPQGAIVSQTWDPFTVELHDAAGELLDVDGLPVTLSLDTGTGSLTGTLTRMTSGGVATFDDLSYDTVEEITLDIEASGLTPLALPIVITKAPDALVFTKEPSMTAQVDQPFGFFVVEVQDVDGRRVYADTNRELVVEPMGSPTGTLSGSLIRSVEYGRLVYSDVRHDTVESITLQVRDSSATLSTQTAGNATSVEAGPTGITEIFVASLTDDDMLSSGTGTSINREPVLSADGRFVTFESLASDLVTGDTNGTLDVFVRDIVAGTTEIMNVSSSEVLGNAASCYPAISADGRYVAFNSDASNVVPGDTNEVEDLVLRDRQEGTTVLISRGMNDQPADERSDYPEMSADGRFIAFHSGASNLVPGDTNDSYDIFVFDMVDETLERVSVASDGSQGVRAVGDNNTRSSEIPDISDDGRYVVFHSRFVNLVPGDTNGVRDVFVRDRVAGTTERVSVSSDGAQAVGGDSRDVAMSGDGRYVAFGSSASNLVANDTNGDSDIFLRDRQMGTTIMVSVDSDENPVEGSSVRPSISEDGTRVIFESRSGGFDVTDTNGELDIYLRDLTAGTTTRLSVGTMGEDAGSGERNWINYISPDGNFAAWEAYADGIASGDNNGISDILMVPLP